MLTRPPDSVMCRNVRRVGPSDGPCFPVIVCNSCACYLDRVQNEVARRGPIFPRSQSARGPTEHIVCQNKLFDDWTRIPMTLGKLLGRSPVTLPVVDVGAVNLTSGLHLRSRALSASRISAQLGLMKSPMKISRVDWKPSLERRL